MTHFAEFCATAQKALENPTSEVKQEVLRLLVESIVIEDETVTIKHIIPTDEKCQLLSRGLRVKTCHRQLARLHVPVQTLMETNHKAQLENKRQVTEEPSLVLLTNKGISNFRVKITTKEKVTGLPTFKFPDS